MQQKGDDLEVIVDDFDAEKWKDIFEEDRVYLISNVDCIVAPKLVKIVRARWQLQLTKESAVYERLAVEVPSSFPYKFAKLSSIPELGEKPQYLIDVIGYVREVKPFRFVPVFRNQVRVLDFYMIDETSYDNPFEVTIWPSLLQKHEDVFLHGDGKPFFLVALSLKIRQFKKSFNLETTNFTQFIFNVDAIPPAQELMHWVMVELPKKRVSHSGSISSGQSEVNRVTINALIKATMNPPQQDKAMTFDVHARIIYISTEKPYFSACRKCGKGVQLADDMEYACPSCPHSGRDADLKFKVSCTIADETDETQICLFDRQAQLVLRLPVQQLLDMYQTKNETSAFRNHLHECTNNWYTFRVRITRINHKFIRSGGYTVSDIKNNVKPYEQPLALADKAPTVMLLTSSSTAQANTTSWPSR